MKSLSRALLSLLAILTILETSGQQKLTSGINYLLGQTIDMSQDFTDLSNTYFFADSLSCFNPSTGSGKIVWTRQQLMPRQAFNTNTYLHKPLQSNDFPETAYEQSPELGFQIDPINERTIRLRVYTSDIVTEQPDEVMLAAQPAIDRGSWEYLPSANGFTLKSAQGSVEMVAHPWQIIIRDANGMLLTKSRRWADNDSTQVKVPPFSFIKRGSDNTRSINPVFALQPGEKIFGCGESFTPLDKVGQKVNLFVTDPQGPETPDMYKPIPFFFSNRGYGIFMHTSAPVTCDFGRSYIGANRLFMADETMDFFIMLGEPKDILGEYTALVGRPDVPPLWSFGTWMSRITYFSEAEGREVASQLRANRIPCDVIHFDTGWFGVDWQCDYQFAADRFDNPSKMLSDLKDQGFHVCLWQLPYFTPKNKFFNELVANGMYVKNQNGSLPYEDVVLDFTNPATVDWYKERLAGLLKLGVGAIKVDFGEGAPLNGIYHNGRGGLYEHNLYPLRYNKAVAEITKDVTDNSIIWARSAWAGSQRYPLHWGGDAATTNTGLLGTMRSMLSIGLSGFSFWSHDIGGFVTESPERLFSRWLPFGFLTSHSRIHGAPPTEPWHFSDEFMNLFRKCAEMKYQLMPYIYSQAQECAANGLPMMRALFVEYPDDPGAWLVEDEYLLGDKILVAPMLEDTPSRNVYLPGSNKWVDYQTGKTYSPGWNEIAAAELPIVVLVPQGAKIPHVPVAQHTGEIDWSKVQMRKF